MGKALHDGQLIDAYFTRSFYKHMLGLALTYEDIEAVDPEYYKNLRWGGAERGKIRRGELGYLDENLRSGEGGGGGELEGGRR